MADLFDSLRLGDAAEGFGAGRVGLRLSPLSSTGGIAVSGAIDLFTYVLKALDDFG